MRKDFWLCPFVIRCVDQREDTMSQYLHYNCYGSGLMTANCSDTQQIYPVGVKVGTKEASLNCSKEYTQDLNWTMAQFDQCCKPDPGDLCIGDYVNVGNPTNSSIFYKYCIGRNSCQIHQVQGVDTLLLSCDQTLYYPQTTFMAFEYDCIDGTHSDVIRIDCPAKPPVTDCNFTTTTELTPTSKFDTKAEPIITNLVCIILGIASAGLATYLMILIVCYWFSKKKTRKISPQNKTEIKKSNWPEKEKCTLEKIDENQNRFETEAKCRKGETLNGGDRQEELSKDTNNDDVYTSVTPRQNGVFYIENESGSRHKKKKKHARRNKRKQHQSDNLEGNKKISKNISQTQDADTGVYGSISTDLLNQDSQNLTNMDPVDHIKTKQKKKNKKRKHSKYDDDIAYKDIRETLTPYKDINQKLEMSQTDDAVGYEYKQSSGNYLFKVIKSNPCDMKEVKKERSDIDDKNMAEENQRKIKKKKKKHARKMAENDHECSLSQSDILM